jgi:hypothetical protein
MIQVVQPVGLNSLLKKTSPLAIKPNKCRNLAGNPSGLPPHLNCEKPDSTYGLITRLHSNPRSIVNTFEEIRRDFHSLPQKEIFAL